MKTARTTDVGQLVMTSEHAYLHSGFLFVDQPVDALMEWYGQPIKTHDISVTVKIEPSVSKITS
jgi:hypothetical protein